MSPHLATSSRASLHRLSEWFTTGAGDRLAGEQLPHLISSARRFHGDTLLWTGCQTSLLDTVSGCMIRSHLRMLEPAGAGDEVSASASQPGSAADFALFQGALTELPLANNSLDALVAHHSLEVSDDPRTALRECARVLSGGGRLVVCAFNPLSIWGLRTSYGRFRDDVFSGMKLISPLRLLDWLAVLGFDCEPINYVAYNLPLDRTPSEATLWRRSRDYLARHQLPIGGAYVVSAVKMAVAARGAGSRLKVRGELAPVAYPKLSSRRELEENG
jgi:SAM-dependent methyltransferase